MMEDVPVTCRFLLQRFLINDITNASSSRYRLERRFEGYQSVIVRLRSLTTALTRNITYPLTKFSNGNDFSNLALNLVTVKNGLYQYIAPAPEFRVRRLSGLVAKDIDS